MAVRYQSKRVQQVQAPPARSFFPDRQSPVPLHRQLAESLRRAIAQGELQGGARLLPSRELAAQLGVSRNTVTAAHTQLIAEGYLVAYRGAGTYVAPNLETIRGSTPAAVRAAPTSTMRLTQAASFIRETDARIVPFRPGIPDLDAFPWATWERLSRYRCADRRTFLNYGAAAGYRPLREAIAKHLRQTRGITLGARNVIVLDGTQSALWLLAQTLLADGDGVLLDDPCYWGARAAFYARGARIAATPVDADGLDAAQVPPRLDVRLVYATPSHHYPLGGTMDIARRRALLAWASANAAYIVEDDYDGEFRFDGAPLPSLQALDRDERVIYLGTFSKVLAPAIRISYMLVPDHLVRPLVAARAVTSMGMPVFAQAVLADFIEEGHFARHLRRMTGAYKEKEALLATLLERRLGGVLTLIRGRTGLHVSALLPPAIPDHRVAANGARHGLVLRALSAHALERRDLNGLVLGYACTPRAQLDDAARRLALAVEEAAR